MDYKSRVFAAADAEREAKQAIAAQEQTKKEANEPAPNKCPVETAYQKQCKAAAADLRAQLRPKRNQFPAGGR
jgi:hypothetical protein